MCVHKTRRRGAHSCMYQARCALHVPCRLACLFFAACTDSLVLFFRRLLPSVSCTCTLALALALSPMSSFFPMVYFGNHDRNVGLKLLLAILHLHCCFESLFMIYVRYSTGIHVKHVVYIHVYIHVHNVVSGVYVHM